MERLYVFKRPIPQQYLTPYLSIVDISLYVAFQASLSHETPDKNFLGLCQEVVVPIQAFQYLSRVGSFNIHETG